jgi:RNase P subunit RPR2
MKTKDRKKIQRELGQNNINIFFNLIKNNFKPEFHTTYVSEVKKLAQSFNIRLSREEKLKFCKKCNTPWNTKTREIRLDSKTRTKNYICKSCKYIRRFKY